MHGDYNPFFGVTTATLIVNGRDGPLPEQWDGENFRPGNTFFEVFTLMMIQVARDYNGLPDVRSLTFEEIQFFYDFLKPELLHYAKLKNS